MAKSTLPIEVGVFKESRQLDCVLVLVKPNPVVIYRVAVVGAKIVHNYFSFTCLRM